MIKLHQMNVSTSTESQRIQSDTPYTQIAKTKQELACLHETKFAPFSSSKKTDKEGNCIMRKGVSSTKENDTSINV